MQTGKTISLVPFVFKKNNDVEDPGDNRIHEGASKALSYEIVDCEDDKDFNGTRSVESNEIQDRESDDKRHEMSIIAGR